MRGCAGYLLFFLRDSDLSVVCLYCLSFFCRSSFVLKRSALTNPRFLPSAHSTLTARDRARKVDVKARRTGYEAGTLQGTPTAKVPASSRSA